MSSPQEPTLTVKTILEANWNTTNCPLPLFNTPTEVKRLDLTDRDAITIYSVARTDTKVGLTNAYRDRVDTTSLDIMTFHSYARMMQLRAEVERIIDLTTVRSSPTTRPMVATYGDPYTANTYDQIIPISSHTQEDRNRKWWRTIIDVELKTWWEAR
jgi:hypothetical protein